MSILASAKHEVTTADGFFDHTLGVHVVSVIAGGYNWSKSSKVAFSTMLGSCMAVCAYDPHIGIGGMNHFLLPEAPENDVGDEPFSSSFRYGSAAIETLLNALYSHGAAKNGMQIKIFGGGKVLQGVSKNIGQKNIDFTRRFFQRENLRINSENVGGEFGRRVIFFPRNGKVLLRALGETQDIKQIAQEEASVLRKVSGKEVESDVELF